MPAAVGGQTGHGAHAANREGRIGPNAVIRVAEALLALEGMATTARVFQAADIPGHLDTPPAGMIAEDEVARLHRALHAILGDARARSVGWIAGRRTADYLLAHRIPRPAQSLLRQLPATAATRLLGSLITRHAWTFAGSGRMTLHHGHPTVMTILGNPLCQGARSTEPWCDYYAATFERLWDTLVRAGTQVVEVACIATGAPACSFSIAWSDRRVSARQLNSASPAPSSPSSAPVADRAPPAPVRC